MPIFSEEIIKKDVSSTRYVKSEELIQGIWTILGVEIVTSNNPMYGANENDALYNRGVLKIGEVLRYTFLNEQGEEKNYDSKSMAFYLGFKSSKVEPNTKITIQREGKLDKTRYTILPI